MKFPALSSIGNKLVPLFYDRRMQIDPGMPAIVVRASLYSTSLIALFTAGYFATQRQMIPAASIGAYAIASYALARWAPLPYAKAFGAISLIALAVIPLAGIAYGAFIQNQ